MNRVSGVRVIGKLSLNSTKVLRIRILREISRLAAAKNLKVA